MHAYIIQSPSTDTEIPYSNQPSICIKIVVCLLCKLTKVCLEIDKEPSQLKGRKYVGTFYFIEDEESASSAEVALENGSEYKKFFLEILNFQIYINGLLAHNHIFLIYLIQKESFGMLSPNLQNVYR